MKDWGVFLGHIKQLGAKQLGNSELMHFQFHRAFHEEELKMIALQQGSTTQILEPSGDPEIGGQQLQNSTMSRTQRRSRDDDSALDRCQQRKSGKLRVWEEVRAEEQVFIQEGLGERKREATEKKSKI